MDHTSRLLDKKPLATGLTGATPAGGTYTASGFGYTTDWVDVHAYPYASFTVVFTGGAPAGMLSLQQSNALNFSGGSPVVPLFVKDSAAINDTADVPAGSGQNLITVAGAGAYVLNQWWVAYRWVRLVYTPTSNVATQMDVFFHSKTGG